MHLQGDAALEQMELLKLLAAARFQVEAAVAPAERLLDPRAELHFLVRAGVYELVRPEDPVGVIPEVVEDPGRRHDALRDERKRLRLADLVPQSLDEAQDDVATERCCE